MGFFKRAVNRFLKGRQDACTAPSVAAVHRSRLFHRSKPAEGCLLQEDDDLMTVSFIPKRRQEPSING
ncbi:unnamed protein product [Spodoptera littoralis]|uniref:Uncharacterized protein n=1 Tax=Spodoptera littoralis TaxID=7109 RepID=A0A9P0IA35_SPOLI|nr:unnamed protein product [Spodoptera littoralis]CAH1642190.1 unnamed protein product [Spodoptera littoralis]